MIVRLAPGLPAVRLEALQTRLIQAGVEFKLVSLDGSSLLVSSIATPLDPSLLKGFEDAVTSTTDLKTEYQLSTRAYRKENTVIRLDETLVFGADKTVLMAGPCALESEKQAMTSAEVLRTRFGIRFFRAGAFKPRTSPYSFQGLERNGLKLLERIRREFGMKIITEVKDESHLDAVAECADIVQIGTKSMYLFNMLSRCGRIGKPILLKRAFMATLKEFLQAADFIMANGNPQVILCERGIRTFEPQTRFSLDLCGAALLKELSHLPLVLDPSHAMGRSAQVPLVAQAAAGLGPDGIMVEVHPDPANAKSDKEQALSFDQFGILQPRLKAICAAVGRELV